MEGNEFLTRLASLQPYQDNTAEMDALKQKKANLLTQMTEAKAGLSPTQAGMSGLMSVLPLLAGLAIAGKQGGVAGSQVGLTTGQGMLEKFKQDAETKYDKAKLGYDAADEEYKDLRGAQRDMTKSAMSAQFGAQRDAMREDLKRGTYAQYGGPGAKVSVNLPPDKYTPGKKLTEEISGSGALIGRMNSLVESFYSDPELQALLEEKPATRPDGSIDLSAATDLLIRGLTEKTGIAASTLSAEKKAQVGQLLGRYLKELSGTAVSDPEYQRVVRNMTGDGSIIPADWGTAVRLVSNYAEGDRQALLEKARLDYLAQNPGLAVDGPEAGQYVERLNQMIPSISANAMRGMAERGKAPNSVQGIKDIVSDAVEAKEVDGMTVVKKQDGTFVRLEDNAIWNSQTGQWETPDAAR